MFKATFSVVPPGGGEQDYSFEIELPALPETGDYVTVNDGAGGESYFIVRRRWFYLNVVKHEQRWDHSYKGIVIEVEFAKGPSPSDDHKRSCQMYANRGKVPKEYDASTY